MSAIALSENFHQMIFINLGRGLYPGWQPWSNMTIMLWHGMIMVIHTRHGMIMVIDTRHGLIMVIHARHGMIMVNSYHGYHEI